MKTINSIPETMNPLTVPDVTLDSKVAFLRQATSYREPTYRVEAIETHMSWVFLTERHAYKLKKPVSHRFLDFSTPDARRHFCREEVRLNQRLAAGVYLGIAELTLEAPGHLQLNGSGEAVDWLVRMRRLPTRHMLDFAIQHGNATSEDIRRVAERLSAFYRSSPPTEISAPDYRIRFVHQIEDIYKELTRPAYQLPVGQIERICAAQSAFIHEMAGLLDERVQAEKVLEGHGDLRPEHICLKPDLAIIDCLEFSPGLRTVDTVDDLAFLALECERLGASELGDLLLRAYREISGDRPGNALVDFYKSCRASLRAAISIRHLNEETFRYSAEWRRRAQEYLRLADLHVSRCR